LNKIDLANRAAVITGGVYSVDGGIQI